MNLFSSNQLADILALLKRPIRPRLGQLLADSKTRSALEKVLKKVKTHGRDSLNATEKHLLKAIGRDLFGGESLLGGEKQLTKGLAEAKEGAKEVATSTAPANLTYQQLRALGPHPFLRQMEAMIKRDRPALPLMPKRPLIPKPPEIPRVDKPKT